MSSLSHYHKCVRKITSAFASLFNNIVLIRENTNGKENQRIIVPLEFGDKEKYIKRLQGDPELDKKVQITLPRMSYQLTGFSYDATRKLNTNNKNFPLASEDGIFYQYNPVPYDFNFSLTIYTRTIEDGNQIIEQIIPYFTPDYTLRVNMISELNLVRNIPIILNNCTPYIDSDGLFNSEERTIFWTLSFTAKGFIFGGIKDSTGGLIKTASVNIGFSDLSNELVFSDSDSGDYIQGESIYQGISYDSSYFKARVRNWDNVNRTLVFSNPIGNITLNQPLVGKNSLTIRIPTNLSSNSYSANVTCNVSPMSANLNSNWTIETRVTEFN